MKGCKRRNLPIYYMKFNRRNESWADQNYVSEIREEKSCNQSHPSDAMYTLWNNITPRTYYDHYSWKKLPPKVRNYARALGYSQRLWDTDQEPSLMDYEWKDLTCKQQRSARALGYNQIRWDYERRHAHTVLLWLPINTDIRNNKINWFLLQEVHDFWKSLCKRYAYDACRFYPGERNSIIYNFSGKQNCNSWVSRLTCCDVDKYCVLNRWACTFPFEDL